MTALETLRGAEALRAAIAEAKGPAGDALRAGSIVSSGWYPAEWYVELHAAIHRSLKVGPEFSRALSKQATKADINSVYRFVLRFISPSTLLAQMPRVWGLYVQGATIELADRRDNAVRFLMLGLHGYSRAAWEDLAGGAEAVLECAGARDVRARITSGGKDGDVNAEIEVFWQG